MQSGQASARGVESRRVRAAAAVAQQESFSRLRGLDSGPSGSAPLPLRAVCPLPPLPNQLKSELALAPTGDQARDSGLLAAGDAGLPLSARRKLSDPGWRTSGGLLGHFHTGRPCSALWLAFLNLGWSLAWDALDYPAFARSTGWARGCDLKEAAL